MQKTLLTLIAFTGLSINQLIAQSASDFKTYKTQATGNFDARNLLQTLVGEGVVLKSFSITKASSDEAYGFFEDKKGTLGMKKGLIMTTGGINGLCAGNTSAGMSNLTHAKAEHRVMPLVSDNSSPDLEKLLRGQKTFDACVIELDIVPTADTLSFNYVFGSEEYDEYVGSQFNDVFAFFITGKGITGEKNLAVVPNTEIPVSVNSINGGGIRNSRIAPSNPTYYVSNVAGNIKIEYDGLTKLMEIRQPVTPYETYHLKMCIADVSDDSFDSGVFLEGQSFVSYEKSYNVLFDKNSSNIEKGYKTLLDNLAKLYKDNTKGKILITGHTDNEGSEELNQALSCTRATDVLNYLKSKGVDESRIVMNCKGETMPRTNNQTEEGKLLNRRVELKISGSYDEYVKKKAENTIAEEQSKLLSNYPNPFSGITTIEAFLLDDVKNAQVVIYDMTGKIIKTIYLLERGKTSAFFDGQHIVNGTYPATLIVDGKPAGSIKLVVAH
ncbi:MAG: choice-of-anchor L domain-containing protein [Bacteroidota bacterium]|nr:choice-of-anchor L domain-containing protein [Bacteroidota bacterium]